MRTVICIVLLLASFAAITGCSGPKPDPAPQAQVPAQASGDDSAEASGKVIRLAADQWPPYNGAPGSETPGFMIDIARRLLGDEGYTVEYLEVPWTRAILGTRDGLYDGIVGAGIEDAPDFIFPERELGLAIHAFYVPDGSAWRFDGLDSLAEVTLGGVRDWAYGTLRVDYIDNHEDDAQRVQLSDGEGALESNIRKLQAGRIDVMVEDRTALAYHLHETNTPDTFTEAGVYCEEAVYVAFSPANPDSETYADILTRGMAKLRASGELDEILASYGVSDWVE